MSQPQILAIILNWKQPEITIECIQALQQMTYRHLAILVLDNGSGDDSCEKLKKNSDNIEIIALPKNLGFAGGCNWGMRHAKKLGYDWVLLINNDAFAAPDMLTHLVKEIEDDVALLAPKIFYEEEPSLIWFAGANQHKLILEMRDSGQKKSDNPRWKTRDVDYLVGTCLLVNLGVVWDVGLLNEGYFMYYEDLDWSILLRKAGYRLRFVSRAHLYHRVSLSTGGEGSALHRYYLARSSVLFFHRHANEGIPILIFLFRFGSAIKIITVLFLQGRWATIKAFLSGLHSGYQAIKK